MKWMRVISFFVDIAISPASQFRLSFPIEKSKEFTGIGTENSVVAVLQYNFAIIDLD